MGDRWNLSIRKRSRSSVGARSLPLILVTHGERRVPGTQLAFFVSIPILLYTLPRG